MKLLFIFSVFYFFALVQEIDARPYPENSWSSLLWPTTSSSDYNEVAVSGISVERADLLTQGTKLANQVLDLMEIVPGLEFVSSYGTMGVNMAENLGKNAMEAVNKYQKSFLQNLLNSQFPMIASGRDTIKSYIDSVLTIIEQAIEGIKTLSSVRENILSSLHQTRSYLGTVQSSLSRYI